MLVVSEICFSLVCSHVYGSLSLLPVIMQADPIFAARIFVIFYMENVRLILPHSYCVAIVSLIYVTSIF